VARAGAVADHGPAKGLVHEIYRKNYGKPTSHFSDVRDAIAINGTSSAAAAATTSGTVPRTDGPMVGSINWIGSSSRPLLRTMSAAATNGFEQGDHNLSLRWRGTAGSNGKTKTTMSFSDPLVAHEEGAPLVVRIILYIEISISSS
jgi:hypothetical protein